MAVAGHCHSLEEKDLHEILTEIVKIGKEPSKLQCFGLALGLLISDLPPSLLNQSQGDPLIRIISLWLRKADPAPTWDKLIEALNAPTVDEKVLARNVARNHGISFEQVQRSVSDSATTPQDVSPLVAQLERSASLHSPPEKTNLPNQPINNNNPQENSCVAAVSGKAADCAGSSVQVSKQYSEDRNREDVEFNFPCLSMDGLSENQQKNLRGRLKKDYERINEKFGQLNVNVRKSLTDRKIQPRQVVHVLMELSAFPVRAQSQDKPLLEDRFDELNAKEDIYGIFEVLRDYTSFFSYRIIAFIVENLGTDQDKENLETYQHEVFDYCKRTIFECPSYSTPWPKFADLIMKVDKTIKKSHTIESMEYFQASVAEILNISEHTLRLCSVEEGCLKLRYQLPWFIQHLVFPLSQEQEELLKSIGVIGLMCGGYHFGQQEQSHQKKPNKPYASATHHRIDSSEAHHSTKGSDGVHFHKSEVLPLRPHYETKYPWSHHGGSPFQKHWQQEHKQVCLEYYLTGKCRFSDKCKYRHVEPIANPSVGYVTPPPNANFPVGRKGRSDGGKRYIVVESDRNPGQEVKIVAEDEAAVSYAKRFITSSKKPISGGARDSRGRRKDCVQYKLMGKCDHENCMFRHDVRVSSVVGYVSHPVGKIPIVKTATRKVGYDRRTGKCYTSVPSERDPEKEVKVYAEDEETLQYAKDQITVSLSKAHNIYIIRCYINPVGVETPNLCLQFSQDKVDERRHVLLHSHPVAGSEVTLTEHFEHLNPESYPTSTYSLLDNPEQTVNRESFMHANAQLRITREYRKHIQTQIRDALVWMQEKCHHPKLEGRFGKISWSSIRGDMVDADSFTVARLVTWLFGNSTHRRMFRTRVNVDGSRTLQKNLTSAGPILETYDFKLSVKNVGELDIRLKFPHGKLQVIEAKINEHKPVIFDVLCLHRQHDIRICLSYHDVLPPDDPIVQKVIAMINIPKPGTLTFNPKGMDGDWTVRMIRHKKRQAFFFEGFSHKYVVSITIVRTYEITREDLGKEQLILEPSDYTDHVEVEVHNLEWESSFGFRRKSSPEDSLAHIMEPEAIPAEIRASVPEPWTPDKIIKDFEKDNFIQLLEIVNDKMELQ